MESGNGAEQQLGPAGARCPSCGSESLRVAARIAAHRLTDDDPQRPHAVTLVLECRCGEVFLLSDLGQARD